MNKLSQKHKKFLLSLVEMKPDWDLIDVPIDIGSLPGIKFKQINLQRMSKDKYNNYLSELEKLFG